MASSSMRLAYTIQEVAEMVGVHESTIDRELAKGEIGFIRIGRQAVRITRAQVEQYLKDKEERRA